MKKNIKRPTIMTDEEAYRSLLAGYTKTRIAEIIGVTRQAITRWNTVPLRYVTTLHKATGIPREHLRPSDYS